MIFENLRLGGPKIELFIENYCVVENEMVVLSLSRFISGRKTEPLRVQKLAQTST